MNYQSHRSHIYTYKVINFFWRFVTNLYHRTVLLYFTIYSSGESNYINVKIHLYFKIYSSFRNPITFKSQYDRNSLLMYDFLNVILAVQLQNLKLILKFFKLLQQSILLPFSEMLTIWNIDHFTPNRTHREHKKIMQTWSTHA